MRCKVGLDSGGSEYDLARPRGRPPRNHYPLGMAAIFEAFKLVKIIE